MIGPGTIAWEHCPPPLEAGRQVGKSAMVNAIMIAEVIDEERRRLIASGMTPDEAEDLLRDIWSGADPEAPSIEEEDDERH